MQSRCYGGIIEHKFLICQGEDVAGGMILAIPWFIAESVEDAERNGMELKKDKVSTESVPDGSFSATSPPRYEALLPEQSSRLLPVPKPCQSSHNR
jgi:hypothetical protein